MITVVTATYNGAHTLPRFLDSMVQLDVEEDWQLLVVDNNSTDNSAQIIKSYENQLPLKYLFEEKKGKNAALNCALDFFKGDLIVFTDDDIIAASDWLSAFRSGATAHSEFSVYGGAIIPHWESQPLALHLNVIPQGPVYGLTNKAWEEGKCSPYNIWGANMAVKSEIFENGFRFDEQVGPNSGNNNYKMGSETSFTSLLVSLGYQCCHLKKPVVEHIIRENQMSEKWIFERAIKYGRSNYDPPTDNYNPKRIFGFPLYLCVSYLKTRISYFVARIVGNDKATLLYWDLKVKTGELIEAKHHNESKI